MKYTFKIPNKNKSTVEVYIAYFTGQHKVFVDGKQIQAIDKYKKLYEIPHSKTTTKKMRLAPKAIDFGLTVFYGDKEIPVAPNVFLGVLPGYLSKDPILAEWSFLLLAEEIRTNLPALNQAY